MTIFKKNLIDDKNESDDEKEKDEDKDDDEEEEDEDDKNVWFKWFKWFNSNGTDFSDSDLFEISPNTPTIRSSVKLRAKINAPATSSSNRMFYRRLNIINK